MFVCRVFLLKIGSCREGLKDYDVLLFVSGDEVRCSMDMDLFS